MDRLGAGIGGAGSEAGAERIRTVILAVAASDAHVVANILIALELRQQNFNVVNLGPCTPVSELCDAASRYPQAEAVLIGSLNGHAYEDLRELPEVRSEGTLDLPIVLGGNLSVGARKRRSDLRKLYDLGVTEILDDARHLVDTLNDLLPSPALAV